MKTTVIGDILTVTQGIIVHGCNCQGVMGGGIALQVRRNYPFAYEAYKMQFVNTGLQLGTCVNVEINENLFIVNALTQQFFGNNPNAVYVDYDAIRSCFKEIAEFSINANLPIHYPAIGAGLANGDWEIISSIIDEELLGLHHTFWLFPG